MPSSTYLSKKTATPPHFDFMIGEGDFYMSTHGVSVTEESKSTTALSDGVFYILNRNTQPIYFNSLGISSVRFRKESAYSPSLLSIYFNETTYDDDYQYDAYRVLFRSNVVGELVLRRALTLADGNNAMILPFQSLSFAASYSVLNYNRVNLQYYGRSSANPTRNAGLIDITLSILCYGDKEGATRISDTITLSVNLINTGYQPAAVQTPVALISAPAPQQSTA